MRKRCGERGGESAGFLGKRRGREEWRVTRERWREIRGRGAGWLGREVEG